MTDNNPTEGQQILLDAFLARTDPATAAQFADAHPELRDPSLVAFLATKAAFESDDVREQRLITCAQILCGTGWPYGPAVVTGIVIAMAALEELPFDRAVLDQAIEAAHSTRRKAGLSDPHPLLLARTLDLVSITFARAYRATGDRGLLEEAIAVQREAVQATPAASADRPGRLNNLSHHLAQLYAATGDHGLLEEAVDLAREAVGATPVTSTDRPTILSTLVTRLGDLHQATGDRAPLEEAVVLQWEVVQTIPATSTDRWRALTVLANRLAALFAVTGLAGLLREAVSLQREAVQTIPATSIDRPGALHNLADHLAELYESTGDRGLLEEAVDLAREAVGATPVTSTDRPSFLNSLAIHLADLYAVTGDRRLLEEMVNRAREAVQVTPATSTQRPLILNNLAKHLAQLYAVTADRRMLDEARTLVAGVRGGSPRERVVLARTRAWLIRVDERQHDRYRLAAAELAAALESFQDQLQERRDLAEGSEGLLGDLAASHLLAGDIHEGLGVIEGDRMWLPAPDEQPADKLSESPLAVAWVIPSQWETVVITCTDHRGPHGLATHVVNKTRAQVYSVVLAALNSARGASLETPAAGGSSAVQDTVAVLCALTNEIVVAIPPAERLLIVPLGISALLPYSAAKRTDETYLIDGTTITIAPSLAWARGARRHRPDGLKVGAFHPGKTPGRRLALDDDRRAFEELVSDKVLDQPTAEQVLAHFEPGTEIGHVSCHGSYNAFKPLESWLDLETELTIRAVLNHATAPWLVNLSACETGIPDLQASEQQTSFPTGFILGGAAHVLATLWPVGNTHATVVNRAFYQRLNAGEHPADALRHALNSLRGAAELAGAATSTARLTSAAANQPAVNSADATHPFWWAPFTHYGSPW